MKNLAKIFLAALLLVLAVSLLGACDFNKTSEYTVTFAYPDGTVISTQTLPEGTAPTEPTEPAKVGYAFLGWYKDKELKDEYFFNGAFDEDAMLYARMVAGFTAIKTAEELESIGLIPTGKYILKNDIDLGGAVWSPIEKLEGTLDGDGHKIHNFTLSGSDTMLGFINTNDGIIENITFDNVNISYDFNTSNNKIGYAGLIAAQNNGTIKSCEFASGHADMKILSAGYNADGMYGADGVRLGGLVGQNKGTVYDCENLVNMSISISVNNAGGGNLTIIGTRIGGIIGVSYGGTVEKASFSGNITCNNTLTSAASGKEARNVLCIGGITGDLNNGSKMLYCKSASNIKVSDSGNSDYCYTGLNIGLMSGWTLNQNNHIINCTAEGSINYENEGSRLSCGIGGAVGYARYVEISNIYADVDITVGDSVNVPVGGLIGRNEGAQISKSVFTGNISVGKDTASYGYIIGAQSGAAHFCYYDSASAIRKNGEAVTPTCTVGEAKELAELQSESFLFDTLGWDRTVWQANDSKNPTLKCFE